jgi:DNA polymerase-3 subunit delta'
MPFRDVIGHRRVVALLARSIRRGTLPPSLLLAGPSGVGKRMLAVAAAQALNCTNLRSVDVQAATGVGQGRAARDAAADGLETCLPEEIEVDGCGTCPACTRIARGIHPDVLVVEPGDTGSIRIDQVREAIERTAYRPFEGRRRVVIIDEADALVVQAQHALLKSLEEPPPTSVFMLVTARPDALLPTVRSRCPTLRFRGLGPAEVATALMGRGRSAPEAHAVAALAEGSIGQALDVNADEFVQAREIALRVLTQAGGQADPRRRLEIAKELLAGTGEGGGADRDRLATYLRAVASILRDVELVAANADRRAIVNGDVAPAVEQLTPFRGERGMRAFKAVDQALAALDRHAGAKIVADWLALQL